MFVKIDDYWGDKPLVLNVDAISSIEVSPQDFVMNENKTEIIKINKATYNVVMTNGQQYNLAEEVYIQLCNILTRRL